MMISYQIHGPIVLSLGEKGPGYHWIGSWVGSRASLDAVEKKKILDPAVN
jgi:hypothetical protein